VRVREHQRLRIRASSLACAAVLVTASCLAGCSNSSKTAAGPTTIPTRSPVHTITTSVVEHDLAIKQSGNTVTVVNGLLSNGRKIGTGQVDCVLAGRAGLGLCTGAATLPQGQIVSAASLPVPPPIGTSTDAIIGGTGRYATARGTITLSRRSLTGDTTVTFHVVLDG